MNWFQIMFLFLVRQLISITGASLPGCELISNYVLIFGSTTPSLVGIVTFLLWIDFKLCSYFWFDNRMQEPPPTWLVVNWFQIMFLFLVRQPRKITAGDERSCELISNYVLIFGSTTCKRLQARWSSLWIDFKLCSYFWFDNHHMFHTNIHHVVNWFQIMFLFLVRQPMTDLFHENVVVNWFQIMFLFLVRQQQYQLQKAS